jgi:hypothetical protein
MYSWRGTLTENGGAYNAGDEVGGETPPLADGALFGSGSPGLGSV